MLLLQLCSWLSALPQHQQALCASAPLIERGALHAKAFPAPCSLCCAFDLVGAQSVPSLSLHAGVQPLACLASLGQASSLGSLFGHQHSVVCGRITTHFLDYATYDCRCGFMDTCSIALSVGCGKVRGIV
jgi:hypothetical protein